MEKISHTLNQKRSLNYRTIEINNSKTIAHSNKPQTITVLEADRLIRAAADLITDPAFKPFFFKTLYIIGKQNFIEAMDMARKAEANCRSCIFVKRIKELRDLMEQKSPETKSENRG